MAVAGDQDGQIIDALAAMVGGMRKAADAAATRWGDAGREVWGSPSADLQKSFAEATEKIDGDTATVIARGEKDPMRLRKVDGGWKIDMSALPNRAEVVRSLPMFQAMASAASHAADEIARGRFANPDEARQALNHSIMTELDRAEPTPATQPTP